MYVCMYECMYVCMYVYMNVCMYVHTYVRTYICTCMCVYMYVCTVLARCNLSHTCEFPVSMFLYTCKHSCLHSRVQSLECFCMHATMNCGREVMVHNLTCIFNMKGMAVYVCFVDSLAYPAPPL